MLLNIERFTNIILSWISMFVFLPVIQPPRAKISEMCHFQFFLLLSFDIWLWSHREKFNIDILAQTLFRSQCALGEARKKNWD